jgi:hypothetical protein
MSTLRFTQILVSYIEANAPKEYHDVLIPNYGSSTLGFTLQLNKLTTAN